MAEKNGFHWRENFHTEKSGEKSAPRALTTIVGSTKQDIPQTREIPFQKRIFRDNVTDVYIMLIDDRCILQ